MTHNTTYSLYEVVAKAGGTPGITYVVTDGGVVVFTKEYMRHVRLVEKCPFPKDSIAWGGILSPEGLWVRRSYDFGDAPDIDSREFVVDLINKVL